MTVKFISHLGTSPDIVIDQMRLTLNEIIAKAHRETNNRTRCHTYENERIIL